MQRLPIRLLISSCVVGFLILVVARCGGRRDTVDGGADGDAAFAEETRPDTSLSGYCTWTAYDGTPVNCLYGGTTTCKCPAGPSWCAKCFCRNPNSNELGASEDHCIGNGPDASSDATDE
jgi:hypothetical protein